MTLNLEPRKKGGREPKIEEAPGFANGWRNFYLRLRPDGLVLKGSFHSAPPWETDTFTALCTTSSDSRHEYSRRYEGHRCTKDEAEARAHHHLVNSSARRSAHGRGGHACGVYGLYDLDFADRSFGLRRQYAQVMVLAAVIGFGATRYYTRGFVAEKVRIERLWLPTPRTDQVIRVPSGIRHPDGEEIHWGDPRTPSTHSFPYERLAEQLEARYKAPVAVGWENLF